MRGKTVDQIKVGDVETFTKTITETDVYLFGGITGDLNPAHTDQVASSQTMFKGRIVHGMFTASMVSTILGMYLPGPGTIFLSQETKFLKPVRFNDTITAKITAVEVKTEKNIVVFESECTNQDGEKVLVGKATVMPPRA
ncbi:MAG: MaoC family dehydratase [Tissierellia bacterium]|nr:MaoC family dehydratase [Tissierellia bacterium]